MDIPSCLAAHRSDIRRCATSRTTALSGHGVVERIAAKDGRIPLIDLAGSVCPTSPCPAVVANHIVYRDYHHLTATFARTLWPALDALLAKFR